jgi:isochorismate pyruvate lyase
MITFKQCDNIRDLRDSVNAIDQEIIRLLGERVRYSGNAVQFKSGEDHIRNPEHIVEFFAQRRAWAERCDVDTQVIDDLYKIITANSMGIQLKLWAARGA